PVLAVIPLPPKKSNNFDVSDGDQDANNDKGGNLLDQLEAFMDKDAQDSEDGPDWMFEAGKVTLTDITYIFCPATHQKQLLCLFTKHFCQHPLFPERCKGSLTLNNSMYKFCKIQGLCKVWSYMWASCILQRCGFCGQGQPHLTYHGCAPPWVLRTFGNNSNIFTCITFHVCVWITLSGYSSIKSRHC
ncbi:hypothetical protein B0H34DRAFT_822526, partial [Crassisporium funariophilum]